MKRNQSAAALRRDARFYRALIRRDWEAMPGASIRAILECAAQIQRIADSYRRDMIRLLGQP